MKKIHEDWNKYLKEIELKSDPDQSRLKVGKKMLDFLFSPLQLVDPRLAMTLKASGQLSTQYMFLYWAIYQSLGTIRFF